MSCKSVINKLKNQSGETFIETLSAVLIISFATMLFAGFVVASNKINALQKDSDAAFFKAVAQCEAVSGGKDYADVYIKDEKGIQLEKIRCSVTSQNGLTSYKEAAK